MAATGEQIELFETHVHIARDRSVCRLSPAVRSLLK